MGGTVINTCTEYSSSTLQLVRQLATVTLCVLTTRCRHVQQHYIMAVAYSKAGCKRGKQTNHAAQKATCKQASCMQSNSRQDAAPSSASLAREQVHPNHPSRTGECLHPQQARHAHLRHWSGSEARHSASPKEASSGLHKSAAQTPAARSDAGKERPRRHNSTQGGAAGTTTRAGLQAATKSCRLVVTTLHATLKGGCTS